VLVVALDDAQATTRLVAAARKRRPDLHIIARATNRTHGHVLVHAGADEVLGEVFDASLRAGRHVLEALGWDPVELAEAERLFAGLERDAHRELSQLWRPDLPEQENEPYRLRSRELAEEIERALSERLTRRPGA
jgi:CPA2 family monovalent cation:H+ antiporter-2